MSLVVSLLTNLVVGLWQCELCWVHILYSVVLNPESQRVFSWTMVLLYHHGSQTEAVWKERWSLVRCSCTWKCGGKNFQTNWFWKRGDLSSRLTVIRASNKKTCFQLSDKIASVVPCPFIVISLTLNQSFLGWSNCYTFNPDLSVFKGLVEFNVFILLLLLSYIFVFDFTHIYLSVNTDN